MLNILIFKVNHQRNRTEIIIEKVEECKQKKNNLREDTKIDFKIK